MPWQHYIKLAKNSLIYPAIKILRFVVGYRATVIGLMTCGPQSASLNWVILS